MKHFNDKVAAITGAGSGMGRSLAIRLAREGCHLASPTATRRASRRPLALRRPPRRISSARRC